MIAGFFAALMSSLSSSFNSSASLFSLDVYNFIRPSASEHEVVLVGRLSTMLLVIAAIAIIPLLKMVDTHIYIKLQALQAYIAPPIVCVFLFGIFWEKASSTGAIWALVIGGSIGFLKIILTSVDSSYLINIKALKFFTEINYLHFAVILFFICSLIIISFSLFMSSKEHSKEVFTKLKLKGRDVSYIKAYEKVNTNNVKLSKTKSEIVHD